MAMTLKTSIGAVAFAILGLAGFFGITSCLTAAPSPANGASVAAAVANDWIARDFPDAGLRARNTAGHGFRNPPPRLNSKSHANHNS